MKYFAAILVLSLCIAGLHGASQKMSSWGFDLFCPFSGDICNCACTTWGFDSGACSGPGNNDCWCYFVGRKPSLAGKRKVGK
ncbi:uncharacterized protein [Mytilus edulis]|uniref:uncharacterized protein n=1 Tax=Mytilus edulis TaxID=6550 RepID=UPI0039F0D775